MKEFDFAGRRIMPVAPAETAEWVRAKVQPNVAATFTLLEARRVQLGRQAVWLHGEKQAYDWAYKELVHHLSQALLGRAYRRFGKLIPNAAVLEGDGEGKRFHIHAAFRCPEHVQIDSFMTSINMHWSRSPWRMGDNKIEPITGGWVEYMLKEGSEGLLLSGTSL